MAVKRLSVIVEEPGAPPVAKTSDRVARALNRRKAYSRLAWHTARRIGPAAVLRTQFPTLLPDSVTPPTVSVEFTNYCNLKCAYCTSPMKPRPQGFMQRATLDRLVRQLGECGRPRVRLVGNGEASLHPEFPAFVADLASATRMLTITTNGQWKRKDIAQAMLDAPVSLIEISLDGMTRERYEVSRPGGKFERLLANLRELRELRRSRRTHVNIRVMLRPSERNAEDEIVSYWRAYADTVMPQHIIDVGGSDGDVYQPAARPNGYPKCTLPFKIIDVHWNGNVPLCTYSDKQSGRPEGFLIGNINEISLFELWNDSLLCQYRRAHRTREENAMPLCNGCFGS